LKALCQVQPCQ